MGLYETRAPNTSANPHDQRRMLRQPHRLPTYFSACYPSVVAFQKGEPKFAQGPQSDQIGLNQTKFLGKSKPVASGGMGTSSVTIVPFTVEAKDREPP